MMKQKQISSIPGEFRLEKLSLFQKNLLVRWINTLDIWDTFLTVENVIEELKTGVLICNILKFHQPNLDFTGINMKARAKKQCLNNIEKAISILFQKGAAPRLIPSAEEIFEGDKQSDKVWLLLKQIFDVFAMHDVTLLMPKIVKWINKSLIHYKSKEQVSNKADELYQDFKSGVTLAQLLFLYVPDEALQPDFRLMYETPINRNELLSNLSYIFNIAIKNNVPIYLKPQEYLDYDQPNFLLLQLYYLYCKFKHENPLFTSENQPQIIFKDEGRIIEDRSSMISSTPKRQQTDASDVPSASMGIIDEVDSVEFSSTMKSQTPSQSLQGRQPDSTRQSKTTSSKMQQFLNPTNQVQQQNQHQQQHTAFAQQHKAHSQQMIRGSQNIIGMMNEDEGNLEDEDEDGSQSDANSDYNAMKKNLSSASNQLLNKQTHHKSAHSNYLDSDQFFQNEDIYKNPLNQQKISQTQIPQFQISEDHGSIFSNTLGTPISQSHQQQQQLQQIAPVILQPPHILERKGLFFEDLRNQLTAQINSKKKVDINEDQIASLYFSNLSGAGNQTAHFNNFNTQQENFASASTNANKPHLNIASHHQKIDSLMMGGSQNFLQNQKPHDPYQDYQSLKMRIADENGDLDELKCLQLLFNPQIVTVQANQQQPIRCFFALKPSDTFYQELNENYVLRLIDKDSRKSLLEMKMPMIDSIVMKNMIQKQFIVASDSGKVKITLDFGSSENNDTYFQALNYIYQRFGNKRS